MSPSPLEDQMKKRINLRLTFVLTLFSVVVVEILLRLFGNGYGSSPIELNQRLHHTHPKNYEFVPYHPGEEFAGHKIFYDEFGYRVKSRIPPQKRATIRRVAFLGDGFTEANSVSWEQSFIGLIESQTSDITVRNFGVASYSPVLYHVQINNEVRLFEPTDIVVQIFENDFSDDVKYLRTANSKTISEINAVEGGTSYSDTTKKILRQSYVARLIRRAQQQLSFLTTDKDRGARNAFVEGDERGKTYETILLISSLANKLNARIFFFIVPNKQLTKRSQCCESDTLAIEFNRFADSHNLNLINLSEVFGNYPHQPKLFFERDVHFTAEGHSITAAAISESLKLMD